MVYDLDGMGMRILRARGGSSVYNLLALHPDEYSPRTRR